MMEIKFIPISEPPPREGEEYLVRLSPAAGAETFTVAFWGGGKWAPDAGSAQWITHYADIRGAYGVLCNDRP